MSSGEAVSAVFGFNVIVSTSTAPDLTGGAAVLNAPVPVVLMPFDVSRIATSQPGSAVLVVAVATVRGVAGRSVVSDAPD
jgi:hypothetical protein